MENAGYEPCQHSDELVSLSWGFAALKLEELWSFRRSRNGHWMSKDTNRCHLRDILLCYVMLPFPSERVKRSGALEQMSLERFGPE